MILSAGLTPAWQQILVFDRVVPGEVNRARVAQACASGKVLNVARAVHALGAPGLALTAVGGFTGDAIRSEFARDGIAARWIASHSPTRTCTTVIDGATGQTTELVENAGPSSQSELGEFLTACEELAPRATVAVLTGSLPPQAPPTLYAEALERLSCPMILDVRGPELSAALPLRPWLVKPNRAELAGTVGQSCDSESALRRAMHTLLDGGARWVLVTQGAGPAWLASAAETYRFDPPAVTDVVNPIGCGDCVAGGIAVRLAAGATVPDAVAYGLAAAAENAAALLPARLDCTAVERRLAAVGVARVA